MGDTSIEWTDAVWNPVTGCTKVSPGCKNCYAERIFPRPYGKQCKCGHHADFHQYLAGENDVESATNCRQCECVGFKPRQFTDVRCHPDRLEQPLHWRKPRQIFVNSMSDLFHEDVPMGFVMQVLAIASLTQHTYQILTKRPERMHQMMTSAGVHQWVLDSARKIAKGNIFPRLEWPLPNVWLGVSVENQEYADQRIPLLLQTPAAVRFVSYEPALGPVDFTGYIPEGTERDEFNDPFLDWIIAGGESGKGARPFKIEWARDVIRQCKTANVPVFVKQMGGWPYSDCEPSEGLPDRRVLLLKDRKGGDPSEWPEDLRVREFPKEHA